MDAITGIFFQFLWPIVLAIAAFVGLFVYGRKKQADGRAAERERAQEARDLASDEAERIRDLSAKQPISKKREGVSKWER